MRELDWLWLWLPIGWLIIVAMLVLSVIPNPPGPTGLLSDKQLHALGFATLTLWFAGIYSRQHYLRLAFAMLILGVLIEVAQMGVSRRVSEWGDIVADIVGIGIGIALALAGLDHWCRFVERRVQALLVHDKR